MKRLFIVLMIVTLSSAAFANLTATEGLAIDLTSAGAGLDFTIIFDPTELLGSRTFGDASTDTIVWTWNRATGTDPTMTFNNGSIALPALTLTTDLAVTEGGTGASTLNDLIILTTHTSGNYVLDVADGTGIDGTAAAEGATYTPVLDLTEISTATFGAGAFTTLIFDAGVTDPTFTMASDSIAITNAATFTRAGNAISDAATAFGGDVTGTIGATVVGDNSHAHTTTTVSGLDISDDTNLSGNTEIVLTGDVLSIGAAITRDSEVPGLETNAAVDSEGELEAILGIGFGASKVATAGYVLVADGTDFESVAMSGDVTIAAGGAATVADESHAHTTTTVSGLDISDDTNLGTAMAAIDLLIVSGDGVDANTATPANGDTKHLATGDQIYDWVIGLGYGTGNGDMLKATYDVSADGHVDGNDVAYGAIWNGDVNAPSMNAVYDKIETLGIGHDAVSVMDSNTVNHTLTGQEITSAVRYQSTQSITLSENANGLKADVNETYLDTVYVKKTQAKSMQFHADLAGAWDIDHEWQLLDMDRGAAVFPNGIVITSWYVDCSVADPTTELNANLYYCDALANGAFPGANPVLVDVLDTTTGNASCTDMSGSDLGSGIIPTGKILYVLIDADPTDTNTVWSIIVNY